MFLGLRTVIYHVSDFERAKTWYTAALGFEPYFEEDFYVGYSVEGYELGLDPDMSGVTPGGSVVAYWGVKNAEEALGRLLSIGGTRHTDVQDVGGGIKVATVLDPFGNVFGVVENPTFELENEELDLPF